MMDFMESGYLYVAVGGPHVAEAIVSAASLRSVQPDARITLITNEPIKHDLYDHIIVRSGLVRSVPEAFLYRAEHMYEQTPYARTFYVDTDTFFLGSCSALFHLLEHFDLCASQAPKYRVPTLFNRVPLIGYDSLNCGVILFNKNETNAVLFRNFYEIYKSKINHRSIQDGEVDQTAFMEAFLLARPRFFPLSPEWNLRTKYFAVLNEEVRLIHGRYADYEKLRRLLNARIGHRIWNPAAGRCIFADGAIQRNIRTMMSDQLRCLIRRVGVVLRRSRCHKETAPR